MPNRFMLKENERAIISGFHTKTAAQKAKLELEQLGVIDLKLSETDFLPFADKHSNEENALFGNLSGLASSIYDAELSKELSIPLSAGPDASGMAGRATDNLGVDVILTVVLDGAKQKKAEKILEKYGAQL